MTFFSNYKYNYSQTAKQKYFDTFVQRHHHVRAESSTHTCHDLGTYVLR
jgi:hypothetical protein